MLLCTKSAGRTEDGYRIVNVTGWAIVVKHNCGIGVWTKLRAVPHAKIASEFLHLVCTRSAGIMIELTSDLLAGVVAGLRRP